MREQLAEAMKSTKIAQEPTERLSGRWLGAKRSQERVGLPRLELWHAVGRISGCCLGETNSEPIVE